MGMNVKTPVRSEWDETDDSTVPLVVDLDGCLLRSDLLVEAAFQFLGRKPEQIVEFLRNLFKGRAPLKSFLAQSTSLDPQSLPYDSRVLDLVRQCRAIGRPVYLASASPETFVKAVAEHLGVFDGWFASSSTENLAGSAKASRLASVFGEGKFDYVGNSRADLKVWAVARRAFAVRVSAGTKFALLRMNRGAEFLPGEGGTFKTWVRLLRVHQYVKNGLVFVPLITSHSFGLSSFLQAAAAMVAFSACASSVYILNDLVDLAEDRWHPTKKNRPFANGTISPIAGMLLVPVLVLAAACIAAAISLKFLLVLSTYFGLTLAYSFFLKRKMIVDVIALAMCYTVRVIGGAVAIGVTMSEWLLAFSMFLFTSLALTKRYVELATRLDGELPDPSNRNYKISDLSVVAALSAAAGMNAVTVLSLYITAEPVKGLYRSPHLLWLICVILMYWIYRIILMAHRRSLTDDPIVFALRDRNSIAAAALIAIIVLAAI